MIEALVCSLAFALLVGMLFHLYVLDERKLDAEQERERLLRELTGE